MMHNLVYFTPKNEPSYSIKYIESNSCHAFHRELTLLEINSCREQC